MPFTRLARVGSFFQYFGALVWSSLRVAFAVLCQHLRIDWPIAIVAAIYLALFAPLVTRNADNPRMLAAFVNDEPFLTMALDGMLEWPYGNPSNYLDQQRNMPDETVPPYWRELRYYGITYYGGAPFDVAMPFYAALRALGAPAFPTAPIILRLISLLAGAATLIALYNIGRLRGFRAAGLFAGIYVLCDPYFNYYVSIAHPDAPQLFLGIIAFACAILHARNGDRASLVAMGLFCGLVQGTKMGGPWTVPMAFAALAFGLFPVGAAVRQLRSRRWPLELPIRIGLLGGAALVAYVITTPYAFLDPFYFTSTFTLAGIHTGNALQQNVTLASWAQTMLDYVGPIGTCLVGLVVIRGLLSAFGRLDRTLVLAIILAASQFFWFALTGKLWHVVGYLLVAFGIMALFSFETVMVLWRYLLDNATRYLPAALAGPKVARSRLATLVPMVGILGGLLHAGALQPIDYALQLHLGRRDNVYALNRWANGGGIPSGSRVLFDDLAYLDPDKVPHVRMRGGILTWPFVDDFEPQYLILSGSLYASPNLTALLNGPKLERTDTNSYSMRLYQDLLATTKPGSTEVPGVELVNILATAKQSDDLQAIIEEATAGSTARQRIAAGIARTALAVKPYAGYWSQTIGRAAQAISPRSEAVVGPELRVFRFVQDWRRLTPAAPVANGTRVEYAPRYAIDQTGAAWLCALSGPDATACSVGADFGAQQAVNIERLRVQWITPRASPTSVAFEFSDDGSTWFPAARFDVQPYAKDAPNFRVDEFLLPSKGSHRFWRLSEPSVPPNNGFGVAELMFYARSGP